MTPGPVISRETFERLTTEDKLMVLYDTIINLEHDMKGLFKHHAAQMQEELAGIRQCIKRGYVAPWQAKVMVYLTSALAGIVGGILVWLVKHMV